MRNIQDPRSKIQRRSKPQDPRPKPRSKTLDLGSWIFSGCWILDLGCFPRLCLLAIIALTGSLFPAYSQTNTAPANRYLFIVETSRSMQRRSDGMLAAVQQLLNSGIGGQLKRG